MLARHIQDDDDWPFDPRTISLQQRIEDLEFELREARGLDCEGAVPPAPWGLHMTIKERQLVTIIARTAGKTRPYRALCSAMYPINSEPNDPANNLHVFLSKVRPKLATIGLRIETWRGQGLRMSEEHAARWLAWSSGVEAGSRVPANYPLTFNNGVWACNDR